jgi:hypothetical protein
VLHVGGYGRFHEQDFHTLTRGWSRAKGETICGRGSTMSATESVRRELPGWFRNYGIRSLADAGAGDRNWSRHLDLAGAAYRGFDLCPRHESVEPFDITSEVLPPHDAILCRHVLNHLTEALVGETVARFREPADYLIANTYPDGVKTGDAKLGMWTKWNLAHWLGEPLETCPDIEGAMAIWRLK